MSSLGMLSEVQIFILIIQIRIQELRYSFVRTHSPLWQQSAGSVSFKSVGRGWMGGMTALIQ